MVVLVLPVKNVVIVTGEIIMAHRKEDDALILNKQAKQALDRMLQEFLVFVAAIQSNEDLKRDAELKNRLENIAKSTSEIRARLQKDQPIMPEALKAISDELDWASEAIRNKPFVAKTTEMLKKMGFALPGAKKLNELPEQKQLDEIGKTLEKSLEIIKREAKVVQANAHPKQRSFFEKFIRAVVDFASKCKEKFMSLFRKKKEATKEKPVAYAQQFLAEKAKSPISAQQGIVAAAAAGKAREKAKARDEATDKHRPKKL